MGVLKGIFPRGGYLDFRCGKFRFAFFLIFALIFLLNTPKFN